MKKHLKTSSRVLGKSLRAGTPLALFTGAVVLGALALVGALVTGLGLLAWRAWTLLAPWFADLPWPPRPPTPHLAFALLLLALLLGALYALSRTVRNAASVILRLARMPFLALGGITGVLLALPWRLVNRWWLALGTIDRMR